MTTTTTNTATGTDDTRTDDTATRRPDPDSTPSPLSGAFGIAAVVGPVLILASSTVWVAGADSARAVLQFYGAALTALGLVGLAAQVGRRMPRAASALALLLIVGLGGGGIGFAVDALHVVTWGSESLADGGAGLAGSLVPTLTGLFGPVGLIALGALLAWSRVAPRWHGIALVAAGVLFPVSRIGEIPALAVGVDLIVIAAVVPLGLQLLRRGTLDHPVG